MIDPSRGERDADVSLVDEESGGFVGEELRRQRIVDQRREERRPTVWHNDFLVEVITRASGTALSRWCIDLPRDEGSPTGSGLSLARIALGVRMRGENG
jgi:hypothetical protein